jgi:S-adenosylmethionine:tRNA ribosyltransferase-isomerase
LRTKASGGKVEILIERIETQQQALAHVRGQQASPKTDSLLHLQDGTVCRMLGREHDLFRLRFETDKDDTVSVERDRAYAFTAVYRQTG